MGRLYLDYIEGNNIYTCNTCSIHLTSYNELISKAFQGGTGKAFLFNKVVNVSSGPKQERQLISGLHIVCDIFCKGCNTPVGWKYEMAQDESQKYKEGKFILEKAFLRKEYWTY